jgi:hypothetical protein
MAVLAVTNRCTGLVGSGGGSKWELQQMHARRPPRWREPRPTVDITQGAAGNDPSSGLTPFGPRRQREPRPTVDMTQRGAENDPIYLV